MLQILLELSEAINTLESYMNSCVSNGGQYPSFRRGKGDQEKWVLLDNGELDFWAQPQASC